MASDMVPEGNAEESCKLQKKIDKRELDEGETVSSLIRLGNPLVRYSISLVPNTYPFSSHNTQ